MARHILEANQKGAASKTSLTNIHIPMARKGADGTRNSKKQQRTERRKQIYSTKYIRLKEQEAARSKEKRVAVAK